MNILITGATGFLGGHIINLLIEKNINVYALIRNKEDILKINKKIIPIIGDFNDLKWSKNLKEIDAIIHTAAIVKHSRRNSEDQINFNVNSTLNLINICNDLKCRMIFVSSSGTVACNKNFNSNINEENANYSTFFTKNWPYYTSKIKAEKESIELAQRLNVPLTIFRPPVMLGPGDFKFRSTGNILKFLNKKFPFLIEGNITFCDIRDVAEAIVNSLFLKNTKQIYNLPGHSMSIEKFFDICEKISGIKKPKFTLSLSFAYPISVISEQISFLLNKHNILPDPVVLEMADHNWDIKSLYANELSYNLRNANETLNDTINWILNNK